MNLIQEAQLEDGLEKVCDVLSESKRKSEPITCRSILCNECPFNGIDGLKKWIKWYMKLKIGNSK